MLGSRIFATCAATAVGAVLLAPGAWAQVPGTTEESSVAPTIGANTYENRILRQINRRREARDRPKVRIVDACLDRYAEEWATALAASGQLVHRDQAMIVATCGLSWAGETLARGFATPKATVVAWMHSPAHRAVIMKRRANRAGIGVEYDADGDAFAVLNFGDSR